MIASSSDGNWRYSQTKIRRSRFRNLSRLDNRRFSTKSCRCRNRFSASSLARDSKLARNRSISRVKSVTIDALVPHLEPPITQYQVVTRHNAEIIIMAVAVISVKLEEVTSLADFANLDKPLYALIYVWMRFAGARWPSLRCGDRHCSIDTRSAARGPKPHFSELWILPPVLARTLEISAEK
jgi:hypothetical protein